MALLVVGCGSTNPDNPGTKPSHQPTASPAATESNAPNPCLGQGGSATAPGARPDLQGYLGLSEHAAEVTANDAGQTLRVAGRDGKCFALTMDYNPERVNIYLQNDHVTAATLG